MVRRLRSFKPTANQSSFLHPLAGLMARPMIPPPWSSAALWHGTAEGIRSHRLVKGWNEALLDCLLVHIIAGRGMNHSNGKGDATKGSLTTSYYFIVECATIRTSLETACDSTGACGKPEGFSLILSIPPTLHPTLNQRNARFEYGTSATPIFSKDSRETPSRGLVKLRLQRAELNPRR